MSPLSGNPERIPVIVASGQSIERQTLVTPLDLMERAVEEALGQAPALRDLVQRVTVVDVMTKVGPSPATELVQRMGLGRGSPVCEVSSIGGNSPQWLVSRAASDIVAGALSVTVIAGAEGIRSSKERRARGLPRAELVVDLEPDLVVGDDRPGVGPAEGAAGLLVPFHIYPMFENIVAARAGRTASEHRAFLGSLLAPMTAVAAANPMAWFPEARSATEIAQPRTENRIVAEPYTKRMTAFLGSDQGAALVVCSLAAAQAAGVADRAVFIWSGAEAVDVRFPTERPDPGTSPAIAAAGSALFAAASQAAGGRPLDVDDVELLDLYSCFPCAVELAAQALGVSLDDGRALTVTGGLPYFGGPGNNYTTHSIAEITTQLRQSSDAGSGSSGRPRFGLATGLGWFITKHALGLYSDTPPPAGFHRGDTLDAQVAIDATACPTTIEVSEPTAAVIIAATVIRDSDGAPTGAPVMAELADGLRVAAQAADDETVAAFGQLDVPGMTGATISIQGGPPRYRLGHH